MWPMGCSLETPDLRYCHSIHADIESSVASRDVQMPSKSGWGLDSDFKHRPVIGLKISSPMHMPCYYKCTVCC